MKRIPLRLKRVPLRNHPEKVDDDYEVGYGKPPKESRWKKGQSGNLKGRPKATKNLKTDLKEELEELVRVSEGGNVHLVSKQRAILKRTVEKALKGDMRATDTIIRLIATHLGIGTDPDSAEPLNTDDQVILDRYFSESIQWKTRDQARQESPL